MDAFGRPRRGSWAREAATEVGAEVMGFAARRALDRRRPHALHTERTPVRGEFRRTGVEEVPQSAQCQLPSQKRRRVFLMGAWRAGAIVGWGKVGERFEKCVGEGWVSAIMGSFERETRKAAVDCGV